MKSLFDGPEATEFLSKGLSLLMKKADRGCILLGVSMLDDELNKLFKSLIPKDTSNKKIKEIFDLNGPFGTLSAKTNIAYVCNILPKDVVESIHKLRKLRNNLAHRTDPFSIKENFESISQVFSMLEGDIDKGLLHMSGELVYGRFLSDMLEMDSPIDGEKKVFNSPEEVVSYIKDKNEIGETLMSNRIKLMFVIGVSVLAALIHIHKDRVIRKLHAQS